MYLQRPVSHVVTENGGGVLPRRFLLGKMDRETSTVQLHWLLKTIATNYLKQQTQVREHPFREKEREGKEKGEREGGKRGGREGERERGEGVGERERTLMSPVEKPTERT